MSLSLSLYQSARKSQSRQKACPVAGGDGLKVIQVPRRFVENEWGGTETAILQTSRVLNALGNRSMIYTTTALCDRRHEQMGGVSVHRHNYLYPFWGLSLQDRHDMDRKGGNLMSFSMLWSLLRTKRPDILHAHTGKRLGGIVRTVARLRGLPYVISLHGGVVDVPGDEMQKMLAPLRGKFEWGRALGAVLGARRVLEDASAIICVGKNEQEAVSTRYPGQRVEWIPNGVDSKRFATGNGPAFRTKNHIPQASKLIVCVGRIDYQKNQLALLPVLSRLLGQQKDVHLALIGPVTVESYREQLIKEISRQGLDGRVTLPGFPAVARNWSMPIMPLTFSACPPDMSRLASSSWKPGLRVYRWSRQRLAVFQRLPGMVSTSSMPTRKIRRRSLTRSIYCCLIRIGPGESPKMAGLKRKGTMTGHK
jgi:glycosyltransferase involved in cell wall biosynthesis